MKLPAGVSSVSNILKGVVAYAVSICNNERYELRSFLLEFIIDAKFYVFKGTDAKIK